MSLPDRLAAALADRYRLERELGAGGMATVYLAQDLKHNRKVAIKVLKPELAAVLGAERFVQEIATTAALQHPNILPLFDSGSVDGFLYYVMPFVEGETLRAKLDRETQLGVDEAVKLTTEVADALQYAHEHGVVHRDIKPENILLHAGRPMVADFGIALAVSAAAGGRMTETGLSLGTPHYMSPEQATAEKNITARSDVYSLGAVLYELLTGQPPHLGGSAQQIIMKIVTEPAAPVTQMRKSVPANVAAAVAKALEKLPADRFATARMFGAALTDPAVVVTRVGAPGARSAGRHDRIAWTVASVALLVVAILTALLVRGRSATGRGPSWLVDLNLPDSASFGGGSANSGGLALSADGSELLYGGSGRIWKRAAGTVLPAAIPGTDGGCCPALSPDGQQIAFIREHDLYLVSLQGGTPKLIGSGFSGGDDIAWTSDGYLVAANYVPGSAGGLVRVKATGGPIELLTAADTAAGEAGLDSPRALPGGRGVVFTIIPRTQLPGDAQLQIGVVGPDGGKHTVLMPGRVAAYAEPGYLLVARADGAVVAVRFDLTARRLIGDPVPVFSVPPVPGVFGWTGYFTVAPTGTVVYVGEGENANGAPVWVSRTGQVTPVDFDANLVARSVSLSADGRIVALRAGGLAEPHIEIRDRATGAISRISPAGRWLGDPSVSADGRTIVYRVFFPDSASGVYRSEVARPEAATRLLPDAGLGEPFIAADGRALYYLRVHPDRADLVVRRLDRPDSAEQVLVRGSLSSRVSPDGRWVAFVDSAGGSRRLFARSTDPARPERWLVSASARGLVRWAPNGREIFFFDSDSFKVAQVSPGATFAVERVTRLFTMSPATVADYAPGPDGRFLFLGGFGSRQTHLLMLSDWRRLLPAH